MCFSWMYSPAFVGFAQSTSKLQIVHRAQLQISYREQGGLLDQLTPDESPNPKKQNQTPSEPFSFVLSSGNIKCCSFFGGHCDAVRTDCFCPPVRNKTPTNTVCKHLQSNNTNVLLCDYTCVFWELTNVFYVISWWLQTDYIRSRLIWTKLWISNNLCDWRWPTSGCRAWLDSWLWGL